jgi:putative membrane protein insertion efficiency factor
MCRLIYRTFSYNKLIIYCCFVISFTSNAQGEFLFKAKSKHMLKEINYFKNDYHRVKKANSVSSLLLNIYQKYISPQISADCIYNLSCSRYSREALNKHGLVVGVLLSADRLMRCSSFCARDVPINKFDQFGLIDDCP